MFIPGALIAIVFIGIAYYLGRKDNNKTSFAAGYWKGRSEGWRACEDMIIERAEEHKIKDKSGKIMTKDDIFETFIQ